MRAQNTCVSIAVSNEAQEKQCCPEVPTHARNHVPTILNLALYHDRENGPTRLPGDCVNVLNVYCGTDLNVCHDTVMTHTTYQAASRRSVICPNIIPLHTEKERGGRKGEEYAQHNHLKSAIDRESPHQGTCSRILLRWSKFLLVSYPHCDTGWILLSPRALAGSASRATGFR